MSALHLHYADGKVAVRGQPELRLANGQTQSWWHWDGARLTARSCRYGMQPVFWRALPRGIALATSPLEILEHGAELDHAALAVFVRLGFFVGQDTPFAGVRQLGPNTTLAWDAERGLRVEEGALPRGERSLLSRHAAISRYASVMREAVQRCLPIEGRLCVPLSGGRDSRHIAFALDAVGVRPQAFVTLKHLPGRPNEDARIAALLAQALGVPHVVLEQPRYYVPNMLRNLRECAMCADEGAQLPPLVDWLRAHADAVFDGLAGDVMSAGLFQNAEVHALYRRGDLRGVANKLFSDWRTSVRGWQHAVDPGLAARLNEDVARNRLLAELERHRHHPNPARSFYFWNRTRREIALQPFALFRGLRVETPFLDAEVWDFLDGLPYEMVADRQFHTDTILQAYPRYAGIPFEIKVSQHTTALQRMQLGASLAPTLLRYGGWRRPSLLMRWAHLLTGARVWWNPQMPLYVLALRRIAERALKRDTPAHGV